MSDTPSPPEDNQDLLSLFEKGRIHIVGSTPYSPAVLRLEMSNGSELFGCAWPGCGFVATAPSSIGSHHRAHTGRAAQRRRARRRPKVDMPSTDNVLTAALALLDRAQDLVDALDSWDSEYESVKEKAAKWDALMSQLTAET